MKQKNGISLHPIWEKPPEAQTSKRMLHPKARWESAAESSKTRTSIPTGLFL